MMAYVADVFLPCLQGTSQLWWQIL